MLNMYRSIKGTTGLGLHQDGLAGGSTGYKRAPTRSQSTTWVAGSIIFGSLVATKFNNKERQEYGMPPPGLSARTTINPA